ncbi:DNA-directed RNA polymerase subunit alpha [Patescibacteria group bacterium]
MLEEISLPSITCEEEGKNRAIFTIKPLYPGYGMTVGNALRRVMLSSLPGAAVTSVKISGADHEFSSVPHVKEDVIEIILNLKQLRLKLKGDETMKLEIKEKGEKTIKAKDIKTPSQAEIMNPDLEIANLGKKAKLEVEIEVSKGRGYVPVEERDDEPKEIGKILVDAIYIPVKKVRYSVGNIRVGKRTDFDQVVFEVETDGSLTPREAFAQSARFLVNHFELFSGLDKAGEKPKVIKLKEDKKKDEKKEPKKISDPKKLNIEEVGFSTRTEKALVDNGIKSVAGLLRFKANALEEKDGIGKKAVQEIKTKLKKLDLNLKE